VVHACDLDTMIIAVAYRVLSFRRPYIIYDILDFIYQFSSPIPLALRNALRWLDSKLMAIADVIVVPDENRLRHVPRLLHQRCRIVHNAPALDGMGPSDSGERVGAAIKVVYVGGLSRDRGIRFLLSACEKFADRLQLSIAGQGVLVEEVREYSGRCSNIEFLGQVPFGTALAMMRDSDLLYAVYDPDCDVNKVASPNKFFEAVSLGKPIMVAAGTSVDEKVDRLRMGYVVEYSEASVHATFASIRREELRQMGENARSGQSVYGYAAAQRVLRQVYEEATRRRQAACSK
jgi:glycosyltransferase involved in cell wall biosynthesis